MKKEILKQLKGVRECTLLLSGGVDSCLLAFLLKEAGVRFNAVSFRPKQGHSSDSERAEYIAKTLGIEHSTIMYDTNEDSLYKYVKKISPFGAKTKTDFECFYPMTYVYASEKVSSTIVSGLGADGLFCISKKGCIHFKEKPFEYSKMLFDNPNYCQRHLHDSFCKIHKKTHIMPYLDPDVLLSVKGMTWDQLNRPKQKQLIFDCAPEFFEQTGFPKHLNYQKGNSLISDSFHALSVGQHNKIGSKSSLGVINQILKNK